MRAVRFTDVMGRSSRLLKARTGWCGSLCRANGSTRWRAPKPRCGFGLPDGDPPAPLSVAVTDRRSQGGAAVAPKRRLPGVWIRGWHLDAAGSHRTRRRRPHPTMARAPPHLCGPRAVSARCIPPGGSRSRLFSVNGSPHSTSRSDGRGPPCPALEAATRHPRSVRTKSGRRGKPFLQRERAQNAGRAHHGKRRSVSGQGSSSEIQPSQR